MPNRPREKRCDALGRLVRRPSCGGKVRTVTVGQGSPRAEGQRELPEDQAVVGLT